MLSQLSFRGLQAVVANSRLNPPTLYHGWRRFGFADPFGGTRFAIEAGPLAIRRGAEPRESEGVSRCDSLNRTGARGILKVKGLTPHHSVVDAALLCALQLHSNGHLLADANP